MRTYKTVQGDTWDIIALKLYPNIGGEKLMHKLLASNPLYRETIVFSANTALSVPDIKTPVISILPPWQRKE